MYLATMTKKDKGPLTQVLEAVNELDADIAAGLDPKETRRRLRETGDLIAEAKRTGFSSAASMGGVARAKKLSAKRKSEIAKKAVTVREAKRRKRGK
jgi:hypothetical protein